LLYDDLRVFRLDSIRSDPGGPAGIRKSRGTCGRLDLGAALRRPRNGLQIMDTITKKDLIDRISGKTASKRAVVKRIIQLFLDEIVDELGKGNRLEFRDFGVFETKVRAPRVAQNPKTLERVHVGEKRTVKFKVGRLMRLRLGDNAAAADHSIQSGAANDADADE